MRYSRAFAFHLRLKRRRFSAKWDKVEQVLQDKSITRIVVEHKDRLTRFGFNYINDLWHGEMVIINEVVEDETDLMQDFVSLVTSFTARLYGRRRSKRQTEKLIKQLQNDDAESV